MGYKLRFEPWRNPQPLNCNVRFTRASQKSRFLKSIVGKAGSAVHVAISPTINRNKSWRFPPPLYSL